MGRFFEYPDEIGKAWRDLDFEDRMGKRAVGWVERSHRRWVSLSLCAMNGLGGMKKHRGRAKPITPSESNTEARLKPRGTAS